MNENNFLTLELLAVHWHGGQLRWGQAAHIDGNKTLPALSSRSLFSINIAQHIDKKLHSRQAFNIIILEVSKI